MAEETVKISSLPPSSSKERVAYDLYIDVLRVEYKDGQKRSRKELLDLYAECLHATSGYREIS
ncbi:hypothetical protein [Aquidulcibacter sp.]|uniref:hypothetical protein n=1 Tax=Aquidulcibacter sp. TaxID=2052990 RepID=UPI0025C2FF9E|nr:hypothetical protein [Aquidulcibacter sp.]MCA3696499.1 hypothetical protein [Aquidulcibacter sp.]